MTWIDWALNRLRERGCTEHKVRIREVVFRIHPDRTVVLFNIHHTFEIQGHRVFQEYEGHLTFAEFTDLLGKVGCHDQSDDNPVTFRTLSAG